MIVPLLIFAYMGANGLFMAISPLNWASSNWTAKGTVGYDEVAKQLREGKILYWRIAGFGLTLLSVVACILVGSWVI